MVEAGGSVSHWGVLSDHGDHSMGGSHTSPRTAYVDHSRVIASCGRTLLEVLDLLDLLDLEDWVAGPTEQVLTGGQVPESLLLGSIPLVSPTVFELGLLFRDRHCSKQSAALLLGRDGAVHHPSLTKIPDSPRGRGLSGLGTQLVEEVAGLAHHLGRRHPLAGLGGHHLAQQEHCALVETQTQVVGDDQPHLALEHHWHVLVAEGDASEEHLVETHAQGVDVGLGAVLSACHDLGGLEGYGAHHHGILDDLALVAESEITQFGDVAAEEHVLGLDVPVEDSLLGQVGQ